MRSVLLAKALLIAVVLFNCSDGGDRPKLLSQDGYQGPPGGTGTTTPPGGSDGGSTISSNDGGASANDGASPSPTPVESHRYSWCTGKLDPAKVYYVGRSIIYGEDHAIFDLDKPGEFCLAMALYDPPIMRADGSLVFQHGDALYQWAPDDAVKYSATGSWTQQPTAKLIGNDNAVSSQCPAGSGGKLGTGVFYDAEKNSAVHVCYLETPRYREDGTAWDLADFRVKTSHSSGVWFGTHTTSFKPAVRKVSGEIVEVTAITRPVVAVRNRTASFWVVDEQTASPYAASLWEVSFDGTATKVVDYAPYASGGNAYHSTLDGEGSLYERHDQTIVKRPVSGGPLAVLFDEASPSKPGIALDKTPPTLPILFSANGGLVSGP